MNKLKMIIRLMVCKASILLFLLVTLLFQECSMSKGPDGIVLKNVDPFIGTGGNGRVIPVAVFPQGMVQLGPDTRNQGSGYHYDDETILGFTHTHKSGGGCGDYQDILLQPTTGILKLLPGMEDQPDSGYRSRFQHKEERASPGLYSVRLADYDIDVSLTATKRCGFHKYVFPKDKEAHVILDLVHGSRLACTAIPAENYDTTIAAYLKIVNNQQLEGYRVSTGWTKKMHVFFVAVFSVPFDDYGIESGGEYASKVKEANHRNIRAHFDFNTGRHNEIYVKVGISPVSIANAWQNLSEEIPAWDFNKAVEEVQSAWQKELNLIQVTGGTAKQHRLFTTGIYNVLMYPMLYMDINGGYRGPNHNSHIAEGFTNYGGYIGTWDIFRAANPLLTLMKPKVANDYIRTLVRHYQHCGLLPVWVNAGEEVLSMQGFHSAPMIADAFYKNIRDYDHEEVYEALINSAMKDTFGFNMGHFIGLKNYKEYGYVPADLENESVAKTLEYAYDDWTVAQISLMMGKKGDYDYFINRAGNYKNVFDKNSGFMRGRLSNGKWREPFDPLASSHRRDDFMEGNAWQWLFFVPHDVEGLTELVGGREKLSLKLDSLFSLNVDLHEKYHQASGDISGLIGQYAHGNEVSQHIAYLYNYLGQPWKTQERVAQIMKTLYDTTPEGYCGNEDTGQMSAWYVFSAMGFYPVTHGTGVYEIGTPSFKKVEFNHGFGGKLTIVANNLSERSIYVQSVKLNGVDYSKNWFQHEDLFNSEHVRIDFFLDDEPNYNRGTELSDFPPSMSSKK